MSPKAASEASPTNPMDGSWLAVPGSVCAADTAGASSSCEDGSGPELLELLELLATSVSTFSGRSLPESSTNTTGAVFRTATSTSFCSTRTVGTAVLVILAISTDFILG